MKKLLILSTLCVGALFASCNKSQITNSNENYKDVEILSQTNQQTIPLSYTQVINDLNNMGAVQVQQGNITNYVNFSGYNRLERYYISSTNEYYNVFVWNSNFSNGFDISILSCTKAWHSDSEKPGCYGEGEQCDLEYRNGEFILICCDDVQEQPAV